MDSWQLRLCAVMCLSSAGCGPVISVASDTEGDEGTQGESSGRITGEDTSGSGSSPETSNPVTTGPSTVTMTTPMPPETTVGPEPTSGSSGEPPGNCWTQTPLYEVPDDFGSLMRDQDNNGASETWLLSSMGPSTTVIITEHNGGLIDEIAVPGFLADVTDVDGDGLRDLVVFELQGGGPPQLGFDRAEGPFSFNGTIEPLDLNPQGGFPAFLDVRDSPAADAFLTGEDQIRLFAGLGDGTYEQMGEIPIEGVPASAATPVRGAQNLAVLAPFSFGGESCSGGVTRLFDGGSAFTLRAESGREQPDAAEGDVVAAINTPIGETLIYRKACTEQGVGLVLYRAVPGTSAMSRDLLYGDVQWITAGDFDGDGDIDVLMSEGGTVAYSRGLPDGLLRGGVDTLLPAVDVFDNRILVADTDGDGRDEAVLRIPTTPGSVVHERVELAEGCE